MKQIEGELSMLSTPNTQQGLKSKQTLPHVRYKEIPEEQRESSASLQEKTLENFMNIFHESRSIVALQKSIISETVSNLQQKLDDNIAAQQKSASNLLAQTVQLHATQAKVFEPLLKCKDEEIAGLRSTLRVINSHVLTLQKDGLFKSPSNRQTEKNPNLDMDNQNQGASHASVSL